MSCNQKTPEEIWVRDLVLFLSKWTSLQKEGQGHLLIDPSPSPTPKDAASSPASLPGFEPQD